MGRNVQHMMVIPELVEARIRSLQDLDTRLSSALQRAEAITERQTAHVWTDIPSARQFAAAYRTTLQQNTDLLRDLLADVRGAAQALRASAAAHAETDARTQELLTSIAARLDRTPTPPTPPGPGAPAGTDPGSGFGRG